MIPSEEPVAPRAAWSPVPEGSPERPDNTTGDVFLGLGLTLLLHGLQIPFAFTGAFFLIGVTQLVYILPALIIAFLRHRPGIAYGLIIGAAITALVNAACFYIIFSSWE